MKTPDEIKKGLECCEFSATSMSQCRGCPYMVDCHVNRPKTNLKKDALAYVQQLERERDAAVKTLKEIGDCEYCKHNAYCTTIFPNCVECEKTDCACDNEVCEICGLVFGFVAGCVMLLAGIVALIDLETYLTALHNPDMWCIEYVAGMLK